ERQVPVPPRAPAEGGRVGLQLDEPAHLVEGVAEEEPGAGRGAEQVRHHGKGRPLDAGEEDGRSAGPVDPAVDLGGLEVRVDLAVDPDELPGPREVGDALPEV